jgi:GT2 family glycosyltransferase
VNAALANLTVVIPVGPGDRLSPALREQLDEQLQDVPVRVVCASAADARRTESELSAPARSPDEVRDRTYAEDPELGPGYGCDARWQVLQSAPGRAIQQNLGAAGASTAYLWFLHADSRLAADTLPALRDFLARDSGALGYFDLRFDDDGPACMRVNAFGARLRSRCLGLPFGDQGLVLPRTAFESLGGFDARIGRGEDHDLVWRARHAGLPLHALEATLYTSARRYAEHGWWRTTVAHLCASVLQAWRFSRPRVLP